MIAPTKGPTTGIHQKLFPALKSNKEISDTPLGLLPGITASYSLTS